MSRRRLYRVGGRWIGPATLPASSVIFLLSVAGWTGRRFLHQQWQAHPAWLPATAVGVLVWVGSISAILGARQYLKTHLYFKHTASWTQLAHLDRQRDWLRSLASLPDPLELICRPILKADWGGKLTARWQQSGYGSKGSRLILLLLGCGALGGMVGYRIGGLILGFALAAVLPLLPYNVVRRRAEAQKRRFGEQVPAALESISAGLAAGLSLQRAIAFSVEELPEPMRDGLVRLRRRMQLGHSVEDSLRWFLRQHPEEGLKLAVEGIILQRRLGGDLVALLEESASLVRDRVELEREVQAVTAQGRLSGWVIAALVPASATLLLTTNPEYVDVLFETVVGQILLVVALALQLMGWAVISRLVRVEY